MPDIQKAAYPLSPTEYAKAESRCYLDPYADTVLASVKMNPVEQLVNDYDISCRDVKQVYISPHPYDAAFEECIHLRRFDSTIHLIAGLNLKYINGRLILHSISESTHAARIPCWGTRMQGAWAQKIGNTEVATIDDVKRAFAKLDFKKDPSAG